MLACVDVHYVEDGATGALLLFSDWTSETLADQRVVRLPAPAEYRPGHFYERELPVLIALLSQVEQPLGAVVIDGYVWLGAANEKGLGAHLYEALGRTVPVVGVAKTSFKGADFAVPVLRGDATRPLHVTAVGMAPDVAAEHVRSMHGPYRIPTLLKNVDRLSRQ
ncbi:endonuclease V [Myxococcaceae bacterium JPH2]|nr:endonuclease V [Myxococcaceae bacterium JPH2]